MAMAIDAAVRERADRLIAECANLDRGQMAEFWDRVLPDEASAQSELAEAFDKLGCEAFNEGNTRLALIAFWPNFLLRWKLVSDRPDERGAIRDFASAADLMGQASLAAGNIEGAETVLTEAFKYRQGLCHDDPTDAHAAYLYGVALNHMGRLENAKGNAANERAYMDAAHAHLLAVDKAWPGVSFVEQELADVAARLAEIG